MVWWCIGCLILGGCIGLMIGGCLAAAREEPKLVPCKECKHNVANMKTDPWDATDYEDIVCVHWMSDGISPDDFCSRGERRESDV